jgi:hypothetical protein
LWPGMVIHYLMAKTHAGPAPMGRKWLRTPLRKSGADGKSMKNANQFVSLPDWLWRERWTDISLNPLGEPIAVHKGSSSTVVIIECPSL